MNEVTQNVKTPGRRFPTFVPAVQIVIDAAGGSIHRAGACPSACSGPRACRDGKAPPLARRFRMFSSEIAMNQESALRTRSADLTDQFTFCNVWNRAPGDCSGGSRLVRHSRWLLRACCRPRSLSRPPGFVALFNGRDFSGWKVPEGDNGHWKVVDGVIDYDAESEAKGDKSLWTEREYRRLRAARGLADQGDALREPERLLHPARRHTRARHPRARRLRCRCPTRIPGFCLRGSGKKSDQHLVLADRLRRNVRHPHGRKQPPEVRAAVTPRTQADKPVGEWNQFEITVRGEHGHGRAERQDGHRERADSGSAGARPDRPCSITAANAMASGTARRRSCSSETSSSRRSSDRRLEGLPVCALKIVVPVPGGHRATACGCLGTDAPRGSVARWPLDTGAQHGAMNFRCSECGVRIRRAGARRSPAYRGCWSKRTAVARWPLDTGR